MTPAQFIDDRNGPAAMAKALAEHTPAGAKAVSAGAIAVWRHRNKVPRTAWPEIMQAYPEVTLEHLKAIEAAGAADAAEDAAA